MPGFRLNGTTGLVGKWRSTKVTSSPDVVVASVKSDGTMQWYMPANHSHYEGKTDDSDLPVTGPTVLPGIVVTLKAISPTVLSFGAKLDGKIINYDKQTLAPDGRSYTDASWSPGKEDEKTTAIYIKQ